MAAELMGVRGFYALFLMGFALSLGPALLFNAFLTWLRTRLQRKEAWFGDTLLHSLFFLNTAFLVALVLLMPMELAHSLRKHGSWPFGQQISKLLEIQPSHPALQAGRRFVRQMAYLLEDDKRPALRPLDAAPSTSRTAPPLRPQPGLKLPAVGRVQPSPNSKKTRLRLAKNGNSLIVTVRLGEGRVKARFLLDTGASYLTISRSMARRLGIVPSFSSPRMTLQTANGRIRTKVGLLPRLQLGAWTLKQVAYVLCDSCSDPQRGLVGLMGLNVLNRFRYTIDRQELWIELTRTRVSHRQNSDIRPFVTFRNLRGETRYRLLRGRSFVLTGRIYNRASQSLKSLVLKVSYLRNQRAVSTRLYRLGTLQANGRRFFRFRDKKPPAFRRYRISLHSASWSR
jgi:clan AA aspartic protease (TIGR02281 family)